MSSSLGPSTPPSSSSFPTSPRPSTGDSSQPRSYLRRVAVPSMDGQDLASSSSTSSSPRLASSSHQSPPHPARTPSTTSTSRPSRSLPPSSLPSPIAGPSTGQFHQLIPDPPTTFPTPSYPPPPPPRGAGATRITATTSYSRNQGQPSSAKGLSKREAYLLNKQRLAGKSSKKDEEEEGLIRLGSNVSSVDEGINLNSWDVSEEARFLDLPRTIISPPRLDPKTVEPFSVHGIPSPKLIWSAGMCEVIDEMGHAVKFRDLISKDPKRKTLVFFIRHIWCGQCQDFVNHSISELDPVALKQANVDVIIISNGHWQVIKKYRELFACPFPMFVDGGRLIYNYLGMTLMNNDFGSLKQSDRSRYNVKTVPGQLVSGIGNGLFKLPLRHPGKLTQLGGEFVFGPASTIHFAHRMQHTSDHWEAVDVAEKAGVDPDSHFQNLSLTPINSTLTSAQVQAQQRVQAQLAQSQLDSQRQAAEELAWQRDWEQRREAELDRIHRKKLERRAGRLRDPNSSRISSTDSMGMSTPPPVPGQGQGHRRMLTREEFEAEMLRRERDRAWEEYQEAEKHRPWSDQEAEDKLANSLSCVRVTGEGGEEYDEEDDGEEGEEQYVQYDNEQQQHQGSYYEEEEEPRRKQSNATTTDGEGYEGDQEQSSVRRKSSLLEEVGIGGWSAPAGSRVRA